MENPEQEEDRKQDIRKPKAHGTSTPSSLVQKRSRSVSAGLLIASLPSSPLLQHTQDLNVNLNDPKLQQAIATFPERVPTDLAALAEKPYGTVRSPTRFLETAIRENWQPETNINPEFTHWYREDRQHNCPIVGAQLKDGVQWVYTSTGNQFRWRELKSLT